MIAFNCRDPSIKRTVCKSCDCLLVSGITSRQRVQGRVIHMQKICMYNVHNIHTCVSVCVCSPE